MSFHLRPSCPLPPNFLDQSGHGDARIGSGGKARKVQMLLPGYIKGWKIGTELDRDGFKHLMHIELRRKA